MPNSAPVFQLQLLSDWNAFDTGLGESFYFATGEFIFSRIGVPVSGLLGGLIGTFAGAYYMRSSIGRIDTDMLNLFFPALAGFDYFVGWKSKNGIVNVLLYALGAGLSLFLFQWWYGKAGFTLAYFMVLVFSLFVQRSLLPDYFGGCLVVVLCCVHNL